MKVLMRILSIISSYKVLHGIYFVKFNVRNIFLPMKVEPPPPCKNENSAFSLPVFTNFYSLLNLFISSLWEKVQKYVAPVIRKLERDLN